MPRHTLGQDKSAGGTRKLELRMPDELRTAADAVLRDGEKISEFVRAAMEAEIRRRKRRQ